MGTPGPGFTKIETPGAGVTKIGIPAARATKNVPAPQYWLMPFRISPCYSTEVSYKKFLILANSARQFETLCSRKVNLNHKIHERRVTGLTLPN